jgi:hypothetical protein
MMVPPQCHGITVSPKLSAVAASTQTPQFTATVTGNVTDLSVAGSVDTIAVGNATLGTISSAGLYTPPGTGGSHTVAATSMALPTLSASALVAVTNLLMG